jgi:hypothetical protein
MQNTTNTTINPSHYGNWTFEFHDNIFGVHVYSTYTAGDSIEHNYEHVAVNREAAVQWVCDSIENDEFF